MLASGFIFAGALGNGFDRLANVGVVDYISLAPSFPVFNIADISITIGLIIFLLYLFRKARDDLAARIYQQEA
jgi:signal peptidase II